MKKSVWVVLLLSSAICFGQSRLTGPKAKNKKAWDAKKSTNVQLVVQTNKKNVTGPKAKNTKPWEKKQSTYQVIARKPKTRVTGPRAKNKKRA